MKNAGKIAYMNVLVLLNRMRLMCDHPSLVDKTASECDVANLIERITNTQAPSYIANISSDLSECPICLEDLTDRILLGACCHVICRSCVWDILSAHELASTDHSLECPICRQHVSETDLLQIVYSSTSPNTKSEITLKPMNHVASTKLDYLMNQLGVNLQNPDIKIVVFR
jgi:SNF2 family DNA or RNA helicase